MESENRKRIGGYSRPVEGPPLLTLYNRLLPSLSPHYPLITYCHHPPDIEVAFIALVSLGQAERWSARTMTGVFFVPLVIKMVIFDLLQRSTSSPRPSRPQRPASPAASPRRRQSRQQCLQPLQQANRPHHHSRSPA